MERRKNILYWSRYQYFNSFNKFDDKAMFNWTGGIFAFFNEADEPIGFQIGTQLEPDGINAGFVFKF